jgi:iron complex transport system ATP-binding protein
MPGADSNPVASPVLHLDEVTVTRRGRDILDRANLTIQGGEHWVLLGANGAGKSTLLSAAATTLHPTRGTIDVLGSRVGRVELAALRRRIGLVDPRHPLTSPLTAREVVLTGLTGTIESPMRWNADAAGIARADESLAMVRLAHRADDRWPTLSQGERTRALLARALVGAPDLLLLDEPSTGLDVAGRELLLEVLDGVAAAGAVRASILVTHHLEEIPRSVGHAVLVGAGRILQAGPIDEVLTSTAVSAAFEHPIEVERADGRWSARALRNTAA